MSTPGDSKRRRAAAYERGFADGIAAANVVMPGECDRRTKGIRIKPIFAWYDFWVGLFYDRTKRRLYVFPVPMLGFYIEARTPVTKDQDQ